MGQGSAEAVTVVVVTARADVVKILLVGAGKVVVVWEAGVSLDSCRSHACPSIRAAACYALRRCKKKRLSLVPHPRTVEHMQE